jgi:cell division protein FtsQ
MLSVLAVLSVLVLLGFVNNERQGTRCWEVDIRVDRADGFYFVDEDEVSKVVNTLGDSLLNTRMEDISAEHIRKAVKDMPGVRDAEVYKSIDGRLEIIVKQCQPIVRVLNRDGTGFYLDKDGGSVPLSRKFTARVPIVLGDLNEPMGLSIHALHANSELAERSLLDEIYNLIEFINKDELLKAQLDHVVVDEYDEFTIIPRVGNHDIKIGEISDLDGKFEKLKLFYAQNLHERDLNKYTAIDLRFKQQVVCRKRSY